MDAISSFLTRCRPYQFEPPLDFVPADPFSFRGPTDTAAACQWLSERHSPAELVASGLAVFSDGNEHAQLHPALSEANIPLFALQFEDPCAKPTLATSRGCIGRPERPLFAVMQDAQTISRLGRSGNDLLLTGSLDDTILLRAVGLPAAPLAGFGDLDNADLELLEELFDVACEGDPGADVQWPSTPSEPIPAPNQTAAGSVHSDPPGTTVETEDSEECRLVLVDWKPSALSLDSPAELGVVIRHLSDLEKYRGLELAKIVVWTPSPAQFEAIQFAVDKREVGWLSDAITRSLDREVRGFRGSRDEMANLPARLELTSATERLVATLLDPASDEMTRRMRTAALAAYQRVAHAEIVVPLIRAAQAACDPSERTLRIQLANTCALYVAKFPTVLEAEFKAAPTADRPGRRADTPVNELLTLGREISRLIKELSPWKKHPTNALRKPFPFPLTIDTANWRNLDSPARK